MSFSLLRQWARRSLPALLAGSALTLVAGASQADTTYTLYSDYASFAAALSSVTVHQFPDGGGATVTKPYYLDDFTVGTTSRVTTFSLMNDGVYGAGQTYLADYTLSGVALGVTPPSGSEIYAMGFVLGTQLGADNLTLKLNFYDVQANTIATAGGGSTVFVGIISSDPLQQVLFSGSSHQIDLLKFYEGTVAAVPEPTSALLFISGGLVLAARRRKA